MKISKRMLITIGAIYIVASIIIVVLVNYNMRKQALIEAESKALMLLNHNLAVHNYLQELKTKLFSWSDPFRPPDYFEPAWMSSVYANRQMNHYFKLLEKSKYYYKECAINARALENEADPHERIFLEQLKIDPKLVERSEVRTLNGQPFFVIMRRGLEMKKSCLQCHSTPDRAPGNLVKIYGPTRGFGRLEGEVVHAISIRIPLAEAYGQVNHVSWQLSGIFLALLGCLFASQTWISKRLLFDPMAVLRQKALEIAESEARLGETIPVPRGPELRDLTMAFNALSRNLRQSHDSLEERVRQRTADLNHLNERLEQDILQRRRAEEALRKAEEKYRNIFENAIEGIFQSTPEGKYIAANTAMAKMFGYESPEDLMANISDIKKQVYVDPQRRVEFMRLLKRDGFVKDFEYEVFRKDGSTFWISENARSVKNEKGEIYYYEGFMQDITERKRAEEEILRFASFPRLNPNPVLEIDLGGKVTYGNEWAHEVLRKLGRQDITAFLPPDLEALIQSYREKGVKRFFREVEIDDAVFAESIHVVEEFMTLRLFAIDITERKRAEKALRESEEKFRTIFDNATDGILLLDEETLEFAFANKKIGEMLGYSIEEIQNLGVNDIHPRENLPHVMESIKKQSSGEISLSPEIPVQRKDGSVFYADINSATMMLAGKRYLAGFFRDITERKQAEEEKAKLEAHLVQAQKMEAIGTLAGGIAHDFNNVLTAILGNIGLAALEDKIGPRLLDRLAQAEAACFRAQTLSQQLLTFAKGGAPVKKPFLVAELLTESTAFASTGSSVKCETSFPEDLWWIEGDPGQIGQAFQNLTINAIQAMPIGGTIKVWAENLTLGTDSGLPLSAGRYIKISVRDQGMGIPAEHLPRIFDPYFTTKQKGSGLGLASAYAIIKKHNGHIAVESKPGVETTFHIYLPAVERQVTPQPEEDRELLVGTGKILVMDDEEMVREVLGRMLARLGYEAEFARDGGEAIEMFVKAQESGQAFAAVILDLTVPGGMGGKEALGKLLEIDPQVKAIVSSGYSDDPVMADCQKYGFSGVVAKPYKISELGKILNQVIMKKA
jgi:PAS domain S-box-containing protein